MVWFKESQLRILLFEPLPYLVELIDNVAEQQNEFFTLKTDIFSSKLRLQIVQYSQQYIIKILSGYILSTFLNFKVITIRC